MVKIRLTDDGSEKSKLIQDRFEKLNILYEVRKGPEFAVDIDNDWIILTQSAPTQLIESIVNYRLNRANPNSDQIFS